MMCNKITVQSKIMRNKALKVLETWDNVFLKLYVRHDSMLSSIRYQDENDNMFVLKKIDKMITWRSLYTLITSKSHINSL